MFKTRVDHTAGMYRDGVNGEDHIVIYGGSDN